MNIGRHDGGPSVPNDYYDAPEVLMEDDPCPVCATPLHVGIYGVECSECGWQE